MNIWAIILAAGASSRLNESGTATPKQFLQYNNHPLFWHCALTFAREPQIKGVIFVFPPEEVFLLEELPCPYDKAVHALDAGEILGIPWKIATGGRLRQDSVYAGLQAIPDTCDTVLVHDSARPFITPELVHRVVEKLEEGALAVIPGISVHDTIKTVSHDNYVSATPQREALRAVQTPQGFKVTVLKKAHALAREKGFECTDDAQLVEQLDVPVIIVAGERGNSKITSPADLTLLLKEPSMPLRMPCTGFGYDVHRYGGNRSFILGGVPIATNIMIEAHSDGDTLLHALIDAMLGCIGGGDIGGMFPDTDPAYAGIASGILLSEVRDRVIEAGVDIVHVDITLVAQVPRITPHSQNIANNIAKLLHLPKQAINVKATTEEHLGFTGEKKGIKAIAVVTGLKPAI